MRALVDTHVLLWWLADDQRITADHRDLISATDNMICVSAVSVAQIAIKTSVGKLEAPSDVARTIEDEGFTELPFAAAHAERLRGLPWHHRDPFDRMLIAQAMIEGIPLLTTDPRIRDYGIDVR